jgi:hypothetical protein
MDASRFDRLTRIFSALVTRRLSMGLLTALGLGIGASHSPPGYEVENLRHVGNCC